MEFISFVKSISKKKGKMDCLLVRPNYYSTCLALGLLKISTLLKKYGNTTELVSPPLLPSDKPDVIFVTSLFTYSWGKVKEAADFYN